MSTSSLRLGRIVDWSVLGDGASIEFTGDGITIEGRLAADGVKARAARDQIRGLMSSDEPFVPFTDSADPTLDGMVKIRSTRVRLDKGALENGRYPWSISAEYVPGGALPSVESPLLGGWRTNSSITDANVVPFHAVPAASFDYYDGLATFQVNPSTLPSATGDVAYYQMSTGVQRRTSSYAVPVAHWYDGAAVIEQAYPDGTYYPIIGRQLYSGLSSTGWRIGNGILRVKAGATAGTIDLQLWQSGAWGTVHSFQLGAADGVSTYTANRINTVSVLRNSPEECRIRLTLGLTTGGINYPQRTTLDLRIRRGARMVECRWSTFGAAILGSVGPYPTEGGTAFLGVPLGGITNTADAQGNIAVIVSASDGSFAGGSSNFDTTGTLKLNGWSFGLGIVKGGLGASLPWRYSDLQKEYLAPYSERMTVVGW